MIFLKQILFGASALPVRQQLKAPNQLNAKRVQPPNQNQHAPEYPLYLFL